MSLKDLTQGGQVTLHNLRMFRQVFTVTFLVAVLSGTLFWGTKTWATYTPHQRYILASTYWADIKLSISGDKARETQTFRSEDGREYTVSCLALKNNKAVQLWAKAFEEQAWKDACLSLWVIVLVFLGLSGFWVWRGKVKKLKRILSGAKTVKPEILIKMLKGDASTFHIGGIPLRKGSETQHILVCGTTGTGKTACFLELLPQIRAAGQRAVIIDTTGEFVSRYYRKKRDILINPFDDRTLGWNPWVDCVSPYHYDEVAAAFIPQTGADRFWSDAARTVFAETLKLHRKEENYDTDYMLRMLLTVPLRELFLYLSATPAASLVDPAGDRTAMSIRAHLSSYLKPLVFLPKGREVFSIRQWAQAEKPKKQKAGQWVFLAGTPDQRETLRPFLTALIGSAVNALMGCKPDPNRRLWFVIDELASLHKQEALPKALAEIRKYGGCIAVGLQDIPQLQAQYGRAEAESLVSLLNTRIIFRNGHPDTARVMSQMLGEQEVREAMEGISYGANSIRDGVSLNDQNRMKPVITPTDLMALENREAYIKLPGNLPITKVKIEIPKVKPIGPGFIPVPGYKTLEQGQAGPPPAGPKETVPKKAEKSTRISKTVRSKKKATRCTGGNGVVNR